MHEQLFKLLDPYVLRARVMPALVAVLPAVLAIAAWFPDQFKLLGSLLAFVAVFGAVSFLSECLRDRGKKLERGLIEEWGGLPSTTLLRHRCGHLNPETKTRYHRCLEGLIPGVLIPPKEAEATDPAAADLVYASCGDFLREQTRDPQKFGLLLSENIQYGTRRNLLGAKPIALWIGFPALASCAAATGCAFQSQTAIEVPLVCSLIVLTCLLFWIFRVDRAWVRTTAFTYAERLLAASELLTQNKKS
jgi:hypothetical protein